MYLPEQARELVAIYDEVQNQLLALLQDREWHTVREARERIPYNLAEAAYRLSGSWINDKHPDRRAAIQGTYARLLARETAHWLVRQGVCEIKHEDNGEDAVRLARKSKGGPARTARAGQVAPAPTAGERPGRTKTPEPVRPAAAPRAKPTGTTAPGRPVRHAVAETKGTEPSAASLLEGEQPFAFLDELEAKSTEAAARPGPHRPTAQRTPKSTKARKKKK